MSSEGKKIEDDYGYESDAKAMLTVLELENFDEKIKNLSGGQKKRAALCKVLLQKPDILILDEPTNHLDNKMSDWLENYLKSFRGVLLMVTHDRYFLDKVAINFGFEMVISENFSEITRIILTKKHLKKMQQNTLRKKLNKRLKKKKRKRNACLIFEKKEWEVIEDEIANLEEDIESIEAQMQENASDYGKLAGLQRSLDEAKKNLLEKYERYEYLSELEG